MISKSDLIRTVAEKTNLTQAKASDVVNTIFDTITDSLRKGEEVRLIGFGSFRVAERAARTARNPRTGEVIRVPAQRRPTFSPGSGLIEAVRGEKRKAA